MVRRIGRAEQKRCASLGGRVTQKLNHGCVSGRTAIDRSEQHHESTGVRCRFACPSLSPIFHTDEETIITVRRKTNDRGMGCFPHRLGSGPNQAEGAELPHLKLMLASRIKSAEQL